MGPDGPGPVGTAGRILVEGAGPPNVRAGAMGFGVIDGRDPVAVPDAARGGLDQTRQPPGDAVGVPAAVLGEAFQGLPGPGLVQGQDRLGDGMLLDVEGHGGDPLGKVGEAAAGEAASEGVEQRLPDGPGQRSFSHGVSPGAGPDGELPPGRFRPGDAAFNTVRLLRFCGVFPGNYCLSEATRQVVGDAVAKSFRRPKGRVRSRPMPPRLS